VESSHAGTLANELDLPLLFYEGSDPQTNAPAYIQEIERLETNA